MADKHKRLKQYSVIIDGKMSKNINFSKGEAEVFVKNFIEARLTHAVLKSVGGLKNIKAYFTDTNYIKDKLNERITSLLAGVTKKLTDDENNVLGGQDSIPPLTEEEKNALKDAEKKLTDAKNDISKVKDDSDFNKENIQSAKNNIATTLENLVNTGITRLIGSYVDNGRPGGGGDNQDEAGLETLDVATENRKLKNGLNKLRKWQFDVFEEEFSTEIWTNSYHEYKYSKTKEDLCDVLSTTIKSLGAEISLDPELYSVKNAELVRKMTVSDITNLQRYASRSAFPTSGNNSYYYLDEATNKIYRWLKESETDPGQYQVFNVSGETVNIEEDIKKALKAAGISYIRIDIDWSDSNEDPESEGDEGFNYPY